MMMLQTRAQVRGLGDVQSALTRLRDLTNDAEQLAQVKATCSRAGVETQRLYAASLAAMGTLSSVAEIESTLDINGFGGADDTALCIVISAYELPLIEESRAQIGRLVAENATKSAGWAAVIPLVAGLNALASIHKGDEAAIERDLKAGMRGLRFGDGNKMPALWQFRYVFGADPVYKNPLAYLAAGGGYLGYRFLKKKR